MMKQEFQDVTLTVPTSSVKKKKGFKLSFQIKYCNFQGKCLNSVLGRVRTVEAKKNKKTALEYKVRKIDTQKSRVCGLDVVVWSHHFSEKFLKHCLLLTNVAAERRWGWRGHLFSSVDPPSLPLMTDGAAACVDDCLFLSESWQGEDWRRRDRIPQQALVRNISVASTSEIDH